MPLSAIYFSRQGAVSAFAAEIADIIQLNIFWGRDVWKMDTILEATEDQHVWRWREKSGRWEISLTLTERIFKEKQNDKRKRKKGSLAHHHG